MRIPLMTRHSAALAVAGLLATILTGCSNECCKTDTTRASEESARVAAVNTVCPIGGDAADGTIVREWKGQTVAFCCDHCSAKWDKIADADKDRVLSVARGDTPK